MKYINGVKDLSDYSTYLLDMWGVMHNGSIPYDGVLNTVKEIRKAGKEIIILSNSSKRTDNAINTLTKLGFDIEDFDQIITSGEVGFRMLSGDSSLKCSSWNILTHLIAENRKKAFLFGSGDGDEEYCNEAGWTLSTIDEADLIIARGTFTLNNGSGNVISKKDDAEQYNQMLAVTLKKAASKKIPMLVTNPDRVRPDEGLPPMPGAIGDAYEKLIGKGGEEFVRRIGKPYPEVYELALLNSKSNKVVMIGDALETDIIGGTNVNCSQCWVVNDGIHSYAVGAYNNFEEGTKSVLDEFNCDKGLFLKPTYILKNFLF
jgi:HAD superfamily hydrolase (TIGR01459 family)